jgi:hypothetical protein
MNGRASEARIYAGMEPSLDVRRDLWVYGWSSLAFEAATHDKKKIEILSAGFLGGAVPYKTDRGILLVQSKRSDILKAYGRPTAVTKSASVGIFTLVYDGLGIAFQVLDPSGTIRFIDVFRPGSGKSIWKF